MIRSLTLKQACSNLVSEANNKACYYSVDISCITQVYRDAEAYVVDSVLVVVKDQITFGMYYPLLDRIDEITLSCSN